MVELSAGLPAGSLHILYIASAPPTIGFCVYSSQTEDWTTLS